MQAWEYDTALYPGPPHRYLCSTGIDIYDGNCLCTDKFSLSVTLSDMETFFGPWTEIKVLIMTMIVINITIIVAIIINIFMIIVSII